nr:unnamed protein product [Digitaria exilis]
MGNMRKTKRGGGDLPRSFRKKSYAFKNEWISAALMFYFLKLGDLSDSKQDVWTGLSDEHKSYLSKSVASIVLFNGDRILFSCSGIAMQHQFITKFLTTATLSRALSARTEEHKDLRIQVRLDGTKLYNGYISECDLDNGFAVVQVSGVPDVQVEVEPFQSALESLPHGEVLAVGRDTSGNIMVKIVELNGNSRVSEDDKDLCSKISEEQLDLDSMGYPILPSSMSGDGMILVNSFEKRFGNLYGKGVWSKLGKRAATIDRNVVALASFNGGRRLFACTGFFIERNGSTMILTSASLVRDSGDENKIVDNLRIDVLLKNGCIQGKLEHCNLHYNIALAGIGGPLIDFDANVIGMNFYDTRIGIPYLSCEEICQILASFDTIRY